MLFNDPKWGGGCLALWACVVGLYLLGALMRGIGWNPSLPKPVGQIVGLLILVAIARYILNEIFD